MKCFQHLCSTDKLVVMLGDFNLPCVDWSHYHCLDNPVYQIFLNFVNRYGFYQHVTEPTRDSNILDLVLSTSSSLVSELFISCPVSTADINTVLFRLNLNAPTHEPVSDPQFYYDFTHADYSNLNAYFSDVDWNFAFQFCFDVEQCWSTFMHVVNTAIELLFCS